MCTNKELPPRFVTRKGGPGVQGGTAPCAAMEAHVTDLTHHGLFSPHLLIASGRSCYTWDGSGASEVPLERVCSLLTRCLLAWQPLSERPT